MSIKKYKVRLDVTLRIEVKDDEVDAQDILEDMDYDFTSMTDGGEVSDSTINAWKIEEDADED